MNTILEYRETNTLDARQKVLLNKLWNSQYPDKLAYGNLSDFEKYLDNLNNTRHILLIDKLDGILGWAFSFPETMNVGLQLYYQISFKVKVMGKLCLIN